MIQIMFDFQTEKFDLGLMIKTLDKMDIYLYSMLLVFVTKLLGS